MKIFYGDRFRCRLKAEKLVGKKSHVWRYAPTVEQIDQILSYRGFMDPVDIVIAEDPTGSLKELERHEGLILLLEDAPGKGLKGERSYPPSKFSDYCDRVEWMFTQRKKEISAGLGQLVGWWGSATLVEMENEVEAICSFMGEAPSCTVEELMAGGYTPSIGDTGEYDLLDGFGTGNINIALSGLRSYHSSEDWYRARYKLLGHLLSLVRLTSLYGDDTEVAKEIGINPYFFKKKGYRTQANRLGKNKLLSWIGRLQQLQTGFRLNPVDIRMEMERVLIESMV